MDVGVGTTTIIGLWAMLKKSITLNDEPAPRSSTMTSASIVISWRISLSFWECLGLAISSSAWAPLIRSRLGMPVGVIKSLIEADSWLKREERVALGGGNPTKVCRLAPPKSTSTSTQCCPNRATATPRLVAITDLPTPPLPPPTAQIVGRLRDGACRCEASSAISSPSSGKTKLPLFMLLTTLNELVPYRQVFL